MRNVKGCQEDSLAQLVGSPQTCVQTLPVVGHRTQGSGFIPKLPHLAKVMLAPS